MGNVERRRHPRKTVNLGCRIPSQAGQHHSRVTEISLDGCYVETKVLPPVGEVVTVAIEPNPVGLMTLTGVVVTCYQRLGFGMGFRDLDKDTREKLARLIERDP